MKHSSALTTLAMAALLSGCGGEEQNAAQHYGPDPKLPEPERGLLPSMKIAEPTPWGDQLPTVPDGFSVTAIATDLKIPRQTLVLPNGDILVAEGRGGNAPKLKPKDVIADVIKARGTTSVESGDRVTLLRDADGDGEYELQTVFAEDLNAPYGLAFHDGNLYVANQDALVRFRYRDGSQRNGVPVAEAVDAVVAWVRARHNADPTADVEGHDAAAKAAILATLAFGAPYTLDQVAVSGITAITAEDNEAAADAGPEDDAEDDLRPRACAIDRLGEREAVGIVRDLHRPVERRRKVALEVAAMEPGRVAERHPAAFAVDRTRHADPHLLDPPLVQHHDTVGQGHRLDLVVRHVDHGGVEIVVQLADLHSHVDPQRRVEVRERLVEQEDLRLAHDRPPDRHPLPLPAG